MADGGDGGGSDATVELTVHKALTLVALNPGGTSNPYVTATIGGQSVSTPVASKTLNPCYDCRFTFTHCALPTILTLRVFNKLPYVDMEDAMGMATVTLFGPCDAQTRAVQLTHGGVAALAQRAPAGCGTLHITYRVVATPPSPTAAHTPTQTHAQAQQQPQPQQQVMRTSGGNDMVAPLTVPPAHNIAGGVLATPVRLPTTPISPAQQQQQQQQQQQSNGHGVVAMFASSPSMTAASSTVARSPTLTVSDGASMTTPAGNMYTRQHAEHNSGSAGVGGSHDGIAAAAAANDDAAARRVGVCTPPSLVPPRVSPMPVVTQPGYHIAAHASAAPAAATNDNALALNPSGVSTYVSCPVPGVTAAQASSNNSAAAATAQADAAATRSLQQAGELFYANNDVPAAQLPPPPPVLTTAAATDSNNGNMPASSSSSVARTHEMAMLPVATAAVTLTPPPPPHQQPHDDKTTRTPTLTASCPHDDAAALARSVDAPPAATATSLSAQYPSASQAPALLSVPLLTPPALVPPQQQQQQQHAVRVYTPTRAHDSDGDGAASPYTHASPPQPLPAAAAAVATMLPVARAPATPPLSSTTSSARTTPSTLHHGSDHSSHRRAAAAIAVMPSQPRNAASATARPHGRVVYAMTTTTTAAQQPSRRQVSSLVTDNNGGDDGAAGDVYASAPRRAVNTTTRTAPPPATAILSSSSSLPPRATSNVDAATAAAGSNSNSNSNSRSAAAIALYADRVYLFEAAVTGKDLAIFHALRRVDAQLTNGFVHCVDYAGATLLHCAAWHGQLAVMQVLLSPHPAEPALDLRALVARTSGNTILHAAACGGQAAVVQWLLYTHATAGPLLLPLRNLRGMTAADCAKEAGFDQLAQQLLSAAASLAV